MAASHITFLLEQCVSVCLSACGGLEGYNIAMPKRMGKSLNQTSESALVPFPSVLHRTKAMAENIHTPLMVNLATLLVKSILFVGSQLGAMSES